jgi:hypothetical protein
VSETNTATSSMSADDARDLFGDAIDGTLSPDAKAAFESVLAADAELNDEYASYRMVVQGVASAVPHVAVDENDTRGVRAPDLARKVTERIRARNKGRYFRDPRISSSQRNQIMLIAILTIFVVLVGIWLVVSNAEILDPR